MNEDVALLCASPVARVVPKGSVALWGRGGMGKGKGQGNGGGYGKEGYIPGTPARPVVSEIELLGADVSIGVCIEKGNGKCVMENGNGTLEGNGTLPASCALEGGRIVPQGSDGYGYG
jgi:hypothetical protein